MAKSSMMFLAILEDHLFSLFHFDPVFGAKADQAVRET